MRDPRFDVRAVVVGTVVAAGLALGLATAFPALTRSDSPDVGPTAATLDEAFSTLYGAALGLLVEAGVGRRRREPARGW
jgi:hypothetical protein